MEKTNFLEETLEDIQGNEQTVESVKWVGSIDGDFSISFEEFKKLADFEYDSDLGGAEICPMLVIVFNDGSWIERNEFNGSSWWEYKKTPVEGVIPRPFQFSKNKHQLIAFEPTAVTI